MINLNRETVGPSTISALILTSTSFPLTPVDGQRVVRSDLRNSEWVWQASLGEWWGPEWQDGTGRQGTPNGQGLAMFNGAPATNTRGIPLHGTRYRFLEIESMWDANEAGNFEFRLNGDAEGRVIPIPGGTFSSFMPPLNATWLIGDTTTARRVLSVFWVASSTGTLSQGQVRWRGVQVRFPGE